MPFWDIENNIYLQSFKEGGIVSQRTILHIDVNSAFLSWQAVYNLQAGETLDLRTIPSVVGGSREERKGIVLAKSTPAREFGIQTGEVLWQAKQKCPNLAVVPPNYELYLKCSKALFNLLQEYSPMVQQFSIDESFMDYTGMEHHFGPPLELAYKLKDRIKSELGFTVNIGIAHNKLLAKVAGDLKKPDRVHTLLNQEEIESKMWPLPVNDLFMVGRATTRKLKLLNIVTIGDLARADRKLIHGKLKSFGNLVWCYANGLDESPVHSGYNLLMKGIGNGTTIKYDVDTKADAYKVLLSLTESVSRRLRAAGACCRVISVEFRTSEFQDYSHQRKIFAPTNITMEIYEVVKELFDEGWRGKKIRHLGVRVTDLTADDFMQVSVFDKEHKDKKMALDASIDQIRRKYGNNAVMRAIFTDGCFSPMAGGSGAEDYPVMTSVL